MKSSNQEISSKSKNQDNISITYQSNEQELINYNQINSSIEKSNSLNDKNLQSKIEIEQKNIQMLIFQRSLYIMKQRLEQNRQETQLVYEKYKNEKYKSLECISIQNLFECYQEVFATNQINLYPYENFNDLATADLVSGTNEDKYNKMINDLVLFTKKNVVKYNEKFYENKMKKKKLKEEEEKKKISELEQNDVSDKVSIVHKNKRGEIISDFQKISESNKKVVIDELIYSITEEDMEILTNNKLLYYGVIPLIIADFIQEKMEKNIKIGIIITNRNFYQEKEDLALEQNIKILYDKEIMKLYSNLNKIDPNEEKDEDLRKLLFESNSIDNKIKLYNELIMENSKKGEDISYLMEMIKKLKEQKILYQKKISEINTKKISLNYNISTSNSQSYTKTINTNKKILKKTNNIPIKGQKVESKLNKSLNSSKNSSKIHLKLKQKKLTKEDIRTNTLKEIFSFYCKQHSFLGRTPTFGDLLTKEELMNLSEFIKFCIDFKIMVKKDRITRIFKQDIKEATLMNFNEFVQCIKKMAILMNEEKKAYKRDKINFYELKKKELIDKEKRKKNKKEKKQQELNNNINNEEEKNIEQNIDQMVMTNEENINNNVINENQNKEEGEKINNENNINNIEEERKEEDKNQQIENNVENKEEKKEENNSEEKKEIKEENKEHNVPELKDGLKEKKKIKKNLITETKEELEEKISKLESDLILLEQKTEIQIYEEFYTYLELDDFNKYQKKMIGYTRPFLVREDDTRNPKKNVKYPVKFNKQKIMRHYEYIIQRKDYIKKQKEIKNIKEKDFKFEERKKKFNKKLQRLEKNYDTKIKKDNYIQLKKNEEDYLKERNNKLTWKYIQKNDYQAFLLNDEKEINNNSIPSQLKDIFADKNDYNNNLGDDDDFINNVYSNKASKLKNSFNRSKKTNQENSRYLGNDSYSKLSDLSID